ncbi:hypothetical protein RIF29_19551 [Crotalaria pallida]|uniref:Uncharacterized protein n=1 Tax=Crotalaria pallida TaxID=3830 RepID=A0AAN9IBI2_CROPI
MKHDISLLVETCGAQTCDITFGLFKFLVPELSFLACIAEKISFILSGECYLRVFYNMVKSNIINGLVISLDESSSSSTSSFAC